MVVSNKISRTIHFPDADRLTFGYFFFDGLRFPAGGNRGIARKKIPGWRRFLLFVLPGIPAQELARGLSVVFFEYLGKVTQVGIAHSQGNLGNTGIAPGE